MKIEIDKAIDKKIISKDGQTIGRITSVSKDSIIVASEGVQVDCPCTYIIPKSRVKICNGAELMLNMHFVLVDKFRA
ncbi:MAG TPA: hypothetical protein VJ729_06185 [Nitrososphaeraceae archaeon]|nr:hypothetical protein [Nitrososphaeraceae archaeon]